MKIDPGFITHWKTERLLDQLGGDGLVVLFRIWGQAQIKRQWKGLQLTPKRLAMETKWKGDENHLFRILTDPDAPWLDLNDDGTFDIHGFEEHQKQVIHLWSQGGKGGRPKKKDSLNSNNKEDTSSYSYSSSYPISEPNGNHMVLDADSTKKNKKAKNPKTDKVSFSNETMQRINSWFGRRPETLWTIQEWKTFQSIDLNDRGEAQLEGMENFYTAEETELEKLHRRTTLSTLLNNWMGELDKARAYARKKQ
jgi:hypothetical protein